MEAPMARILPCSFSFIMASMVSSSGYTPKSGLCQWVYSTSRWSVCRRRRLSSTSSMMLLAERSRYTCTPSTTLCRMGVSCRHSRPHLVESTTLSRSMCFMASPTTSSLWYSP